MICVEACVCRRSLRVWVLEQRWYWILQKVMRRAATNESFFSNFQVTASALMFSKMWEPLIAFYVALQLWLQWAPFSSVSWTDRASVHGLGERHYHTRSRSAQVMIFSQPRRIISYCRFHLCLCCWEWRENKFSLRAYKKQCMLLFHWTIVSAVELLLLAWSAVAITVLCCHAVRTISAQRVFFFLGTQRFRPTDMEMHSVESSVSSTSTPRQPVLIQYEQYLEDLLFHYVEHMSWFDMGFVLTKDFMPETVDDLYHNNTYCMSWFYNGALLFDTFEIEYEN